MVLVPEINLRLHRTVERRAGALERGHQLAFHDEVGLGLDRSLPPDGAWMAGGRVDRSLAPAQRLGGLARHETEVPGAERGP